MTSFLIVIAIILATVAMGYVAYSRGGGIAAYSKVAIGGITAIVALAVVSDGFYTIDQRERGVILRNGKIVGTAEPGLGFKVPIIDSVVPISTQTHTTNYAKLNSYSFDQQAADIDVAVTYRVLPSRVADIYSTYGSLQGLLDREITPRINGDTKIVFGRYTAEKAVQERGRLNNDYFAAVKAPSDAPFIVEAVRIGNVQFSKAYEKSNEEKQLAEVAVQTLRQNAEKEKVQAEITVTQAKAKADSVRAEALAAAEATRLKGDADANAITARGNALRENPTVIDLVKAERWDGKLPTTMLPGSAVPMLGVGATQR